jgi:hypothetical protein
MSYEISVDDIYDMIGEIEVEERMKVGSNKEAYRGVSHTLIAAMLAERKSIKLSPEEIAGYVALVQLSIQTLWEHGKLFLIRHNYHHPTNYYSCYPTAKFKEIFRNSDGT